MDFIINAINAVKKNLKMNPHKFRHTPNGDSKHGVIIYCEYCGLVAFQGAWPSQSEMYYETAKKGCPCSPVEIISESNCESSKIELQKHYWTVKETGACGTTFICKKCGVEMWDREKEN